MIGLLTVRRLRGGVQLERGSVPVELSVVEQRYRAVLAVLTGESVTSVAAPSDVVGVSLSSRRELFLPPWRRLSRAKQWS